MDLTHSMLFSTQDLKFWPATQFTIDSSSATIINKFTTQLSYEPIASPTNDKLSFDRLFTPERSYQQYTVENRRKSTPDFVVPVTIADSLLQSGRPSTNSWLQSLQNLTVDFSNCIENGFSGNGTVQNTQSGEHQPLAGINSEFSEDMIYDQKYT